MYCAGQEVLMPNHTDPCPRCRGALSYRLGEYECAGCGYRGAGPSAANEAAPGLPARALPGAPKLKNSTGSLTERDAASYGGGWTPAQSAPPKPDDAHPGYSRIGLKSLSEQGESRPAYNVEKVAFLMTYIVVQIVIMFVSYAQIGGAKLALFTLPSLISNAVISTAGAAIVLYVDNSLIKNGCMILLGLNMLMWGSTILMAFRTGLLGLAWGIIINVALFGWMISILSRDTEFG
jgi:hypothetical protein